MLKSPWFAPAAFATWVILCGGIAVAHRRTTELASHVAPNVFPSHKPTSPSPAKRLLPGIPKDADLEAKPKDSHAPPAISQEIATKYSTNGEVVALLAAAMESVSEWNRSPSYDPQHPGLVSAIDKTSQAIAIEPSNPMLYVVRAQARGFLASSAGFANAQDLKWAHMNHVRQDFTTAKTLGGLPPELLKTIDEWLAFDRRSRIANGGD